MIGKQINQYLSLEHINPHGSLEGTHRIVTTNESILSFLILRLFHKIRDAAIRFAFQDSQARRFFTRDRMNGHRYIGIILPMELSHFGIVHTIKMITSEDQDILRTGGLNFKQLLAHRVRGALIPGLRLKGLLGGPDLHPARMERVEVIGLRNMTVEGYGIELRQNCDAVNLGVDGIADGNVNQPILTGHRHRRFGTHLRQWIETLPASAAHDHCQYIVHCCRHRSPPQERVCYTCFLNPKKRRNLCITYRTG